MRSACTKTITVKRRIFLAAKSTEVELNMQLNEDSLILSVGQCSWKKKDCDKGIEIFLGTLRCVALLTF